MSRPPHPRPGVQWRLWCFTDNHKDEGCRQDEAHGARVHPGAVGLVDVPTMSRPGLSYPVLVGSAPQAPSYQDFVNATTLRSPSLT